MSLLGVDGVAVVAGTITLPRVGRWVADLELEAAPPAPRAKATLKGPALSLVGHVARSGSFVGAHRVRLCGGAGGLALPLPGQHFRSMPISLLLDDLLGLVDERRSPTIDQDILGRSLTSWVRPAGAASQALTTLADLLGVVWRVLADGTIWLGEDTWRETAATGELLDANPMQRTVHAAFETMAILPGQTFKGLRVDVVSHTISDTGFRTELATQ